MRKDVTDPEGKILWDTARVRAFFGLPEEDHDWLCSGHSREAIRKKFPWLKGRVWDRLKSRAIISDTAPGIWVFPMLSIIRARAEQNGQTWQEYVNAINEQNRESAAQRRASCERRDAVVLARIVAKLRERMNDAARERLDAVLEKSDVDLASYLE